MGYPDLGTEGDFSYLKYHTSWDWLMPVLKKINLRLHPDTYGMWRRINVPTEYTIEEVHAQVVEFIKEYNDEPFICGSCREHCSEYTYSEDRDVDECNNCKTSNHENNNPR